MYITLRKFLKFISYLILVIVYCTPVAVCYFMLYQVHRKTMVNDARARYAPYGGSEHFENAANKQGHTTCRNTAAKPLFNLLMPPNYQMSFLVI